MKDQASSPEKGKAHDQDEITLVAPNGATMAMKLRPHDTVGKLLDKAVKEFSKDGALDGSVSYHLVRNAGVLDNGLTLQEVDIESGERLSIRAQAIPSDGHAPCI